MFSRHALRSSSAAFNLSGGVTFYSLPGATVNTQTTYSIRIPDNITSIAAVAIGAGGGGGGCNSGATESAGGGGGGALSYSNRIAVTPGETLTVLVPNNAGAGSTGGTSGTAGLTASIARGATILLSAVGGSGSGGVVTSGNFTVGANGGAAASGVGDVKYSGGKGGNGIAASDQGGGGGGAAGYAGNGGIGGTAGGNGNNAPSGSGGGGGGGTISSTQEGGYGGGVLWYGKGSDGVGGLGGSANFTSRGGKLGSSLGGTDAIYLYGVDYTVGRGNENMNALPGGGGGGAPSGGTASYSGVRGAGGAVRIIWGPDVDWGTAKNTSLNRLSVRSTATSSSSTIAMPEVELGDTAIFIDFAENTSGAPTAVTPSGFTIRLNSTTGTRRLTTYYKRILSSAETGTSLTGANGTASNAKIIIVVRGRRGASFSTLGTDTALNGSVGATNSTGGASFITGSASDPYATGIPVHFAFFNSTVDLTSSSIDFTGVTLETITVAGPNAKTFIKLGFLPQEINGSYATGAYFTSTTATNTFTLWEARFY